MKSVVIVEDEILAAKKLHRLLKETIEEDIEIVATLDSVKNAAKYLAQNQPPDVLFLDIQLGDGLSFEIFDIVEVNCPIIFTTAFNEYALEAFKLNSIAYLLKPINGEDLNEAWAKLHTMKTLFGSNLKEQLFKARQAIQGGYKERFMVKAGSHIKAIPVEEICYLFSQDKATFLRAKDGRSYIIDYTLEQAEELLDPVKFFRINRKYLVSMASIQDIISYSNSRLQLTLANSQENDAIVSRQKVSEFKKWLDS